MNIQDAAPYIISVPGLPRATRILHLTDAHFCLVDEDSPHSTACRERRSRWAAKEQEDRAKYLLQNAPRTNCDLILLSGDIVDFPSQVSINTVRELLDGSGVPWLYVPGNHDWYFPGQKPDAALRRDQSPHLHPLYNGEPSLYWRHEINGLQILGIDNSTYQIESEQLDFARECLHNGLPTVLMLHIPITQPLLREPTIAKWRDPILLGEHIAEERRPIWAWQEDTAFTAPFIELLYNSPNLVAILCGHVHFAHDEPFGQNAVQLVGAPAFDGGFRLVEFQP